MQEHNLKKIDDALWLTEYERDNLRIGYRIKEIVSKEKSAYQEVVILDSYDFGRMLVLDGVVQTTEEDGHIYNEMITHVPLTIHPHPKKVLIIGGGDCGAAREVAKHERVEQIDVVEIDEVVVKQCKEHLQKVSGDLSDPRVHFIFQDGIQFVNNTSNEYEVIIVDSSDPVGPAKPLFEQCFYEQIFDTLKEDGLMVCQSQSPVLHMDILKQTTSNIKGLFSVRKVYKATIPTYPGGMWSFTLGSKKYCELDASMLPLDTKYLNRDILYSCFQLPQFLKREVYG